MNALTPKQQAEKDLDKWLAKLEDITYNVEDVTLAHYLAKPVWQMVRVNFEILNSYVIRRF